MSVAKLFAVVGVVCGSLVAGQALAKEHAPSTQPAKHAASQPAEKYTCPMGCETSNHPGKCAKCGMELKKQSKGQTGEKNGKNDEHHAH